MLCQFVVAPTLNITSVTQVFKCLIKVLLLTKSAQTHFAFGYLYFRFFNSLGFLFIFCLSLTKGQRSKRQTLLSVYEAPVHTETFSCVFVLFQVMSWLFSIPLRTVNNTKTHENVSVCTGPQINIILENSIYTDRPGYIYQKMVKNRCHSKFFPRPKFIATICKTLQTISIIVQFTNQTCRFSIKVYISFFHDQAPYIKKKAIH